MKSPFFSDWRYFALPLKKRLKWISNFNVFQRLLNQTLTAFDQQKSWRRVITHIDDNFYQKNQNIKTKQEILNHAFQ